MLGFLLVLFFGGRSRRRSARTGRAMRGGWKAGRAMAGRW